MHKCPTVVRGWWAQLNWLIHHCETTTWNFLMPRFMEDVKPWRRVFFVFRSACFRELWSNFSKFHYCFCDVKWTKTNCMCTSMWQECDVVLLCHTYVTYMSQIDCIYYIYYCIIECHRYGLVRLACMLYRSSLKKQRTAISYFGFANARLEYTYTLRGKGFSRPLNLVPRGRDPFGQRQGSGPLG